MGDGTITCKLNITADARFNRVILVVVVWLKEVSQIKKNVFSIILQLMRLCKYFKKVQVLNNYYSLAFV